MGSGNRNVGLSPTSQERSLRSQGTAEGDGTAELVSLLDPAMSSGVGMTSLSSSPSSQVLGDWEAGQGDIFRQGWVQVPTPPSSKTSECSLRLSTGQS